MKNWLKHLVEICSADMTEEQVRSRISELDREYHFLNDSQKQGIREVVNHVFDARDSVYILSELVHYLNCENLKRDLVQNILRAHYDWFESTMVQFQMNVKNLGTYEERRCLNKKTYDMLEQLLLPQYTYIPLRERNTKRIALITEQILVDEHAPTKLIFEYIYTLRKLGYEVLLFACPSDGGLLNGVWYHPVKAHDDKKSRQLCVEREYRGIYIKYFQINLSSLDCAKEYAMMLALIQAWNPLFVHSYGLVNSIGDLCKNITTVVSETMGAIDCPISEAQILVRIQAGDEEYEKNVRNSLNENQSQLWIPQNFPVNFPGKSVETSRCMLGLPDEQFIIVIVGNRLEMEIEETFITLMKKIMKSYSGVSFAFIGTADKLREFFEEESDCGRVFFLGYQKDLESVYSVMDLYMNPKRMGGGYSGAMALHASLPVVTLPDCDVAYNVGSEFVVSDYDEMFQMVGKYTADSRFRETQKKLAFEKAKTDSEQSGEHFVDNKIKTITQIILEQENGKWNREYRIDK